MSSILKFADKIPKYQLAQNRNVYPNSFLHYLLATAKTYQTTYK